MNLEHGAVPKDKEVPKQKQDNGYVTGSQESTERDPNSQIGNNLSRKNKVVLNCNPSIK